MRPADYLATEDLRTDLERRSTRGGIAVVGGRAAQVFLFLVSAMVMARLLTPRDFGLYAMVASLATFVAPFRDFGIPMATVHRRHLDQAEASALFWVAVALNLLTGLFVAAMAPVLVWLYGEPKLVGITLVMAAGIVCMGLGMLHDGLLVRRMLFATLAMVDITAALAGLAAGVGYAIAGAGYWALVYQFLVTNLTRTVGLWWACRWRPGLPPGRSGQHAPGVRQMLAYGRNYTAYRFVHNVGYSLDRVLIGYFAGATAMGLYDNAFRWSRYPQEIVSTPLLDVAVSGLSRVRHSRESYRTAARRALTPVFALVFPVLAFMAADSDDVIVVLLGKHWVDAIPYFRLLCISGLAACVLSVTHWFYLSSGQTGRQLQWGLISTPILAAAVSMGVIWGALGVAVAFTVATSLLMFPAVWFCLMDSPFTTRDVAAALWRPALSCAVASATLALTIPPWGDAAPLIRLTTDLALFALLYAGTWLMVPGGREAISELIGIVARHVLGRGAAAGGPEST